MIQYNTFGKTREDNDLVDFLNSLREQGKYAENIQRSVMKIVHSFNSTVFQCMCHKMKRDGHPMTYDYHKKFKKQTIKFWYDHYRQRIEQMTWRHPIKCKVIGLLNKRFELLGYE